MRKITALLSLFVLSISLWASAPPPVLSTTHHLQDATGVCAGTAVGPHALLTAHHCEFAGAVMVDGAPRRILSVVTDGNDHDILYVDGAAFPTVAVFANAPEVQGDDVWIRGNPAGLVLLVRRGIYAGDISDGKTTLHMYDMNGWFGDSGSAIFNEKGEIVDVLSSMGGPSDHGVSFKLVVGRGLRFTPEQLAQAAA